MKRVDQGFIQLEQWFTTGTNDQSIDRLPGRPLGRDLPCQFIRSRKLSAIDAVDPHEIRIAESANSRRAIPLQPGPKIAPRESTKDGWPPGIGPFALQCVEDVFD
jgi:hypothetical protein